MYENNEILSAEDYENLINETSNGMIGLRCDSIKLDTEIENKNSELRLHEDELKDIKNLVVEKRLTIRKNKKELFRMKRSLSRQNKYMKAITKAYTKSKLLNVKKFLKKYELDLLDNDMKNIIDSYFVNNKKIEINEENFTTFMVAISNIVIKLKVGSKKKTEILKALRKDLVNLMAEQKSCESKIIGTNKELTSLNVEQRKIKSQMQSRAKKMENINSVFMNKAPYVKKIG